MDNRLILVPTPSRPPWKRPRRCISPCRGFHTEERNGDYVTISCSSCGTITKDQHQPRTQLDEINEQRALEVWPLVEEPELTLELEKYCDLRRRGHDDEGIWHRTGWPEYYRNLLLEEAMRRGMKGADENRDVAFREWLLERYKLGIGLRHICRLSGRSQTETHEALLVAIEIDESTFPQKPFEKPPRYGYRKPQPEHKLDTSNPQLTEQLETYCDWRRRGQPDMFISLQVPWPEYYLELLLEEAARRGMPGSNENPHEAFHEWLLEVHTSGMPIDEIYRLSYRCETDTIEELTVAIENDLRIQRWKTLQENYAEATADANGP